MNFMYFVDNFYNKSPKLRILLMKLIYGSQDILVNLFGLELYINSLRENGYFRASRMVLKGSLLRDEVSILLNISSLLRDGDTFVDVGANIGLFSSVIARASKFTNLQGIYAFEANNETFKRLEINSKTHGFEAFNIGISNQECELMFVDGAVSHVFTTTKTASRYNINSKTTLVKCNSLDQINIKGNSIIIKIDVEGQELAVLEGARSFFEAQRVKAIYLDGFANQTAVLDFLYKYNFYLFDGRTLKETNGNIFSLLAVHEAYASPKLRNKKCEG
ncbi:FkbM family methyltransferase [Moorena sp. SIO4A5]|uniref:FkbM family methyltransferase n=1 Tax=Moorena sp. SIO4A5 TaxID=2607838 RepID=UPI0013C58A9E|nr:FkbM family methyltransferase [Moorena sp. SIO4A5]NEO23535.1 FkbM family methyltransferase [Moorena sp. SIO4A5]